jgi:hypothetical protein
VISRSNELAISLPFAASFLPLSSLYLAFHYKKIYGTLREGTIGFFFGQSALAEKVLLGTSASRAAHQ